MGQVRRGGAGSGGQRLHARRRSGGRGARLAGGLHGRQLAAWGRRFMAAAACTQHPPTRVHDGWMRCRIRKGSYSEKAARRLVREMVRAVAQCHGMHVMLRDIKPENVRGRRCAALGLFGRHAEEGAPQAPAPASQLASRRMYHTGCDPDSLLPCAAALPPPPTNAVHVPGPLPRVPPQGH